MNMIARMIGAFAPARPDAALAETVPTTDLSEMIAEIKIKGVLDFAALNERFKAALADDPRQAIEAVGLDMTASEFDLLKTSLQAQNLFTAGPSVDPDPS